MATVLLNFTNKTVDEKLTITQAVITGCTNNPHLPDANPPKVVELATRRYRLAVARAAVAAAKIELASAVAEQDEAEDEVDEGYSELGDYVQDETNGDPVEIPTTGFGVASDNTAPVTLTAPEHFDVTTTEVEGKLHADWDAMRGARGFETERTTDLTGETGWGDRQFSTESEQNLTGLTSGTKYIVRVRALGASGTGPWVVSGARRAP